MTELVGLLVLLGVTSCYSSCPALGRTHNGTCYWISSTQDSWDNAMVRCSPGTLAEVKSADVNKLLVSMATMHFASTFWIGGKDDVRGTGGWMWMGSKTQMNIFSGYQAWRQSYPRNMFTRMFLGTRCAMVKNAQWEDTKCDERLQFVCQL